MARGKSGRIVLEIDPVLKKELYAVLTDRDETMKEWFVREANRLIYGHAQPSLFRDRSPDNTRTNDSE